MPLVSKIWTAVAVRIDETHLPEVYTYYNSTSFYFHNVTAYELFIVHEIMDIGQEHDLCQLIPGRQALPT